MRALAVALDQTQTDAGTVGALLSNPNPEQPRMPTNLDAEDRMGLGGHGASRHVLGTGYGVDNVTDLAFRAAFDHIVEPDFSAGGANRFVRAPVPGNAPLGGPRPGVASSFRDLASANAALVDAFRTIVRGWRRAGSEYRDAIAKPYGKADPEVTLRSPVRVVIAERPSTTTHTSQVSAPLPTTDVPQYVGHPGAGLAHVKSNGAPVSAAVQAAWAALTAAGLRPLSSDPAERARYRAWWRANHAALGLPARPPGWRTMAGQPLTTLRERNTRRVQLVVFGTHQHSPAHGLYVKTFYPVL